MYKIILASQMFNDLPNILLAAFKIGGTYQQNVINELQHCLRYMRYLDSVLANIMSSVVETLCCKFLMIST